MDAKRIVFPFFLPVFLFFSFCNTSLAQTETSAIDTELLDTLSFNLSQAKDYAVEHSYEIRKSDYEIEKIDSKTWEVLSIGFPKVAANAKYTYAADLPKSRLPASTFNPGAPEGEYSVLSFGVLHDIQARLSANQLIFDASYIIATIAVEATEVFTKNKKEVTKAEVLKSVSLAYVGVLISQENIKILENSLKTSDKVLSETQKMFQEGLVEEQDVQQLQISSYEISTTLFKIKRLRENNKDLLKMIMGIPLETPISLSDRISDIFQSSVDFTLAISEPDISNSVNVKLLDASLKLAKLDYDSKFSEYFPKLNGFMNGGYNTGGNEFDVTSEGVWLSSLSFGLQLTIPISDVFLTTRFKVQQAHIDYEKSKLENYEEKQRLQSQLNQFRREYLNSIDQYNTSMQQMNLATQIYKKEEVKYIEGIGSSLNLSQAQSQLYQKQQAYLDAMYQVIRSKLDLERLMR